MSERRPEDYDRDFADIVARIEGEQMTEPEHGWLNLTESIAAAEPDEPSPTEWKPAPLPPPTRPSPLAAVGWGCSAYCLAVIVLTISGVSLPAILGWVAVAAFLLAMAIGVSRLPRSRDPHDGDGAVV